MNNSKMMQVSNPMLIGAMELLKKDKSPESIKMFMDEVLHARFLAPVVITPEPEVGEDGKVKIDPTMCNGCGLCKNYCKFDAIKTVEK